jgi:DNA-binding response OmpR family regulator
VPSLWPQKATRRMSTQRKPTPVGAPTGRMAPGLGQSGIVELCGGVSGRVATPAKAARRAGWPLVLVVGPDRARRQGFREVLTLGGWHVQEAAALPIALAHGVSERPNLVVIDWRTGDAQEIADLRAAKARHERLPLLVVCGSGHGSIAARALEAGAVDFVPDPFHGREFLARCWRFAGARSRMRERVTIGALSIDVSGQSVELHGQRVDLTRAEFHILSYLARRPGAVVPDAEIVSTVLGDRYRPGCTTTLRVHVCRLRRKLGTARWVIQNVPGRGYRFQTGQPSDDDTHGLRKT